jgi:hypothetical protein
MTLSPEVIIGGAVGLISAIVALFWLYVKNLQAQISELKSRNASLEQINDAAIFAGQKAVAELYVLRGQDAPVRLAPVISEHQSPPSASQLATARLATQRAAVVALYVALGLPPVAAETVSNKE